MKYCLTKAVALCHCQSMVDRSHCSGHIRLTAIIRITAIIRLTASTSRLYEPCTKASHCWRSSGEAGHLLWSDCPTGMLACCNSTSQRDIYTQLHYASYIYSILCVCTQTHTHTIVLISLHTLTEFRISWPFFRDYD